MELQPVDVTINYPVLMRIMGTGYDVNILFITKEPDSFAEACRGN